MAAPPAAPLTLRHDSRRSRMREVRRRLQRHQRTAIRLRERRTKRMPRTATHHRTIYIYNERHTRTRTDSSLTPTIRTSTTLPVSRRLRLRLPHRHQHVAHHMATTHRTVAESHSTAHRLRHTRSWHRHGSTLRQRHHARRRLPCCHQHHNRQAIPENKDMRRHHLSGIRHHSLLHLLRSMAVEHRRTRHTLRHVLRRNSSQDNIATPRMVRQTTALPSRLPPLHLRSRKKNIKKQTPSPPPHLKRGFFLQRQRHHAAVFLFSPPPYPKSVPSRPCAVASPRRRFSFLPSALAQKCSHPSLCGGVSTPPSRFIAFTLLKLQGDVNKR